MRQEPIKSLHGSRLAGLLLAALSVSGVAQAGPHGEKIEFSEPSTPITIASNLTATVSPGLDRLNPTPNAFKQVQEDLFGSLVNKSDSFDPVMTLPEPAPQQRSAPSKRMKELKEKRKNWAFTDLDNLSPDPTTEDPLGLDSPDEDAKPKAPASLMEKYLNGLGQKNAGQSFSNVMAGYDGSMANPYLASNGLTARPFAESDPTKALFAPRGVPTGSDEDVAPGFKSPFFVPQVSGSEMAAAQKRTEEFRQLLDHTPALAPTGLATADGSSPFGIRTPKFENGNNPLGQTSAEHRSSIYPVLGFTDPTVTALHNRVFDDPTASALGQPNPLPQQPVVAPVDPGKLTQRMLDPFSSVVTRPRF